MDEQSLVKFAISVGEIMLRSGAEIQRVEDTISRILAKDESHNPEVFATPSGIFASIHSKKHGTITIVKRLHEPTTNLEKLTLANSLSREFVSGQVSLKDAILRLEKIDSLDFFPYKLQLLAYGLVCLSFTALFSANVFDSIASFINGVILCIITLELEKRSVTPFLRSLIGGFSIAVFAVIFSTFISALDYNNIVIGSIMPLVPGVAITNAVRDIMNRDFLSGVSRVGEASLIAVSVATGIGLVLSITQM